MVVLECRYINPLYHGLQALVVLSQDENWLKARKDPITEMIRHRAMARRKSGIVISLSFAHQLAPSASAASYRSGGMACIAPIKISMVRPEANQTTMTVIAVSAGV